MSKTIEIIVAPDGQTRVDHPLISMKERLLSSRSGCPISLGIC